MLGLVGLLPQVRGNNVAEFVQLDLVIEMLAGHRSGLALRWGRGT